MKKIIYSLFTLFTLLAFNCTPSPGQDSLVPDKADKNNITGLTSYVLQSTAHNRLEWDLLDNVEYNIYRYQLQSDAGPDLTILNHITNEYEDDTADIDTPWE